MTTLRFITVFTAGITAGLMLAICTNIWMGRPGSAGGEVLILPLIGLLLYVGYEWGRITAMARAEQRRLKKIRR